MLLGPPLPLQLTSPGRLSRLDPETGAAENLTMGGYLVSPTGVALEPDGGIIVGNSFPFEPLSGAIVRVDPDDGTQSLLVGGMESVGLIAIVPAPVEIDIRPARISVGAGSRRILPVALLGSNLVDIEDVDMDSLAFGSKGAAPVRSHVVGRGRNASPDLLLFFRADEAGLAPGDREACLKGWVGVFPFQACDDVAVHGRSRERCTVPGVEAPRLPSQS